MSKNPLAIYKIDEFDYIKIKKIRFRIAKIQKKNDRLGVKFIIHIRRNTNIPNFLRAVKN